CELASFDPFIAVVVEPALAARRALREQYDQLHRMLLDVARKDDVCRRLMTMPGVGPVVALNYRVAIDITNRFVKSRTVGAHIGLTPMRYQSGEVDWTGRISKFGDPMARASLYEAAQVLLTRTARHSGLRSWAMRIAKRRGRKRAVVALARKMGVILHRMWVDETDFRWDVQPARPKAAQVPQTADRCPARDDGAGKAGLSNDWRGSRSAKSHYRSGLPSLSDPSMWRLEDDREEKHEPERDETTRRKMEGADRLGACRIEKIINSRPIRRPRMAARHAD